MTTVKPPVKNVTTNVKLVTNLQKDVLLVLPQESIHHNVSFQNKKLKQSKLPIFQLDPLNNSTVIVDVKLVNNPVQIVSPVTKTESIHLLVVVLSVISKTLTVVVKIVQPIVYLVYH